MKQLINLDNSTRRSLAPTKLWESVATTWQCSRYCIYRQRRSLRLGVDFIPRDCLDAVWLRVSVFPIVPMTIWNSPNSSPNAGVKETGHLRFVARWHA